MSHFVYDNLPLSPAKTNLSPIPVGANPDQYVQADEDWNPMRQAVLDIRGQLLGAKFYGVEGQDSDPAPVGIPTYLWVRTTNDIVLHMNGANHTFLTDSRSVYTDPGAGLQGGGTLSGDLHLSISSLAPDPSGDYNRVQVNSRGQIYAGQLEAYVLETRQVLAGAGLTGGGALSADVTIEHPVMPGLVAGTYNHFDVDVYGHVTAAGLESYVLQGRRLSTTAPLLGGGDLSGDLTLSHDVSGVTAGQYNLLTVDDKGHVTLGSLESYVLATRQVSAGTGLSGGGDLSQDRTITHANAGTATQGPYNKASYDALGHFVSGTLESYVLADRTVSAGTGLSGGGDLSADRTITHAAAGTATQGPYNQAQYDALGHFVSGTLESYVLATRSISTAARLAGGGDLSADRTLDLATLSPDPTGVYPYLAATVDQYGRVTAAAAAPPPLRQMMALALNGRCTSSAWQVLTDFTLNPANYPSPAKIKFLVTAFATTLGTTGNIKLYNLTDGADVANTTFSFTDQAPLTQASIALTLPSGNKVYEVRVQLIGGSGTDEIDAQWVGLQIDPT